jgi:hypothetical protein
VVISPIEMILENMCQIGGQIYGHHPTTTEELCSVLLTGKGSVISIFTKLGYVKTFTPCVPLIPTYVHKKAMRTIPIGPLWCYSVTCEDYLSLITIGDETWICNFEAGPTRHHIMSPGTNQFNVISSKNHDQFSVMWRQDCTFISHILGPQPT